MSHHAQTSLNGLSVLVVEDEPMLRRKLAAHLERLGADVTQADTTAAARRLVADLDFDFALVDVNLPDGLGLDLLREGAFRSNTGVVIMTAQGGIEGAVEAMRLGALDYLAKPFDPAVLPLVMRRARQARQSAREAEHRQAASAEDDFFFGEALAGVRAQLDRIIAADQRMQTVLPPVLVTGETGSGKSTIARWLHRHGPRAAGPMVEVNCSALPDTLAESELFGHERGAFTDARMARQGLFEAAHGGTLFLDELPSLSLPQQAKVLTAIEDRCIRRLGGNRRIEVDVRIVAATSRDLRAAAAAGDFREDLRQRLDLYRVALPPLRERGPDMLRLAQHLMAQICRRHRLPPRQVGEAGQQRLLAYRWPGNVRELAHELERALVFEDAAAMDFAHLPDEGGKAATLQNTGDDWLNPHFTFPEQGFVLDDAMNRLLQLALKQSGENLSRAARLLGVTRDFVRYRLYGDRKANPHPETRKASP
ncbi:MAG: sigma-54-dependent Fis family transcriptional regulator [Verrucomicrobia bacterium]|nr:sigma-54-dependent Fis family transcriptional regulator [Verrucomicrobiota bacterium]